MKRTIARTKDIPLERRKTLSIHATALHLRRSDRTIVKHIQNGLLVQIADGSIPMWSIEQFLRTPMNAVVTETAPATIKLEAYNQTIEPKAKGNE